MKPALARPSSKPLFGDALGQSIAHLEPDGRLGLHCVGVDGGALIEASFIDESYVRVCVDRSPLVNSQQQAGRQAALCRQPAACACTCACAMGEFLFVCEARVHVRVHVHVAISALCCAVLCCAVLCCAVL